MTSISAAPAYNSTTTHSDLIASSPPIPQHELDFYIDNSEPQVPPSLSPDMSTSASVTSDGFSTASGSSSSPLYIFGVNPAPEYISQPSAAQVATESSRYHSQPHGEEEDAHTEIDGRAAVSERAVAAVNAFLDKLLHDILSLARSTQLRTLRPAVAEILKRNLARDTIAFADANLEDLLAAPEDEEDERPSTQDSNSRWNLEYVWKRARLRVMMRSEKSDFDIDDDDKFVQQEGLVSPDRRFSETATVISLSSEIFLAGVLDFLAEHIFALAALPAVSRVRRSSKKSSDGTNSAPSHFIIEEADVEKAVLNSPIDRLWRNWRRSLRARGFGITGSPLSPRQDYSTTSSPTMTRRGSQPWGDGPYHHASSELATPRGIPGEFIETPQNERPQQDVVPHIVDHDYPEYVLASNIPVPVSIRDVDEIEVPGLARDPDEIEEWQQIETPRRKSYAHPELFASHAPAPLGLAPRPVVSRQRSNSEPRTTKEKTKNVHPTESTPGATQTDGATARSEAALNVAEGVEAAVAPKTMPAGAAIAGVVAGGTAAIAAATAMEASRHPLDNVTFSTDVKEIETPPKSSARISSVPNDPYLPENASDTELDSSSVPHEATAGEKARNRETVVGDGSLNGISIPRVSIPVSNYNQNVLKSQAAVPHPPSSSSDMPAQMLAASESDTESSDLAKSPRDFLASRNLGTTRSSRSTATLKAVEQERSVVSKVSMTDFSKVTATASPVSPITPVDRTSKFADATRVLKSDRQISRSPSTSPRELQEEFSSSRSSPRTSPKIGMLKDPGSDAMTAMPRRESSLRRLAVDRHGSLVSLVDESSHKIRPKLPLTSSSITSAEDFDSLIAGGETIKMTLSPSTVRDAPSPSNSRHGSIDQSIYRSRIGSREDVTKTILNKRPPLETVNSSERIEKGSPNSDERGRSGSVATSKSGRSFSRPSLRNKSKTRTGLTAREPIVQTDSTRDFADFIRSTGPDKEPQTLVPALTTRKPSMADRKTSLGGQNRPSSNKGEAAPPVPAVSHHAGVQTGPGLHAGDPDLNDRSPNVSMSSFARDGRDSVSTMATMATYSSRAPLISNGSGGTVTATTQPAYASTTPRQTQKESAPPGGDGRTRYRNKDPYAIDISDEDDDDDEDGPLTALPRQGTATLPEKKISTGPAGGSLGDVVRSDNVANGPGMHAPTQDSSASGPSGLALNGVSYNTALSDSQPSTTTETEATSAPKKGYIPRNPYRKTQPAPQIGPRTAGARTTATQDLADFLRSSGPDVRPAAKPLTAPSSAVTPKPLAQPSTTSSRVVGGSTASSKRDFSGGAPSPNIGGSHARVTATVTADKEKEKKGKFWQRSKRYADLP